MKKVLFLCAAGVSTELLVRKATSAAKISGKENEYVFLTKGIRNCRELIPEMDCILVAPQIRFSFSELQNDFPDREFIQIPAQIYTACNGREVMRLIEGLTNA